MGLQEIIKIANYGYFNEDVSVFDQFLVGFINTFSSKERSKESIENVDTLFPGAWYAKANPKHDLTKLEQAQSYWQEKKQEMINQMELQKDESYAKTM